MEGKKVLKDFYEIIHELEKNILEFQKLEKKLKKAKENKDKEEIVKLEEQYEKISNNISLLKKKIEE